ncbi:MAG: hypothetical protein ACLRQZ_07515 [Clostridia bacterium]
MHIKRSKTGMMKHRSIVRNYHYQNKENITQQNLIEMPRSESLPILKLQIYKYIEEHEDDFIDEEYYLDKISMIFDDDLILSLPKMKIVQYLIIYYMLQESCNECKV